MTRVPTVLHATLVRIDGGVPVYVDQLATAMQRWGWNVVVAGPDQSRLRERLDGRIPFRGHAGDSIRAQLPTAARSLRTAYGEVRPDVVHLHSSWAGALGRVLLPRRGSRPSVVFQPHAWSFSALHGKAARVGRELERRLAARADLTLCGSLDERDTGRLIRLPGPFRVVDNAVDTTHFTPISENERRTAKAELGIDPDAPLVVTVGRIAAQKRIDLALDAWEHVSARRPDARYLIVGSGPLADELRRRHTANVIWLPRTDHPERFHRIADLTLLTSAYETRSLALLEAMACGSPVVTTDIEGVRDLVSDATGASGPGCIATAHSPAAVAEAILAMLGRDLAHERAAARAMIEPRFGLERWERELFDTYCALLQHRSLQLHTASTPTSAPAAHAR